MKVSLPTSILNVNDKSNQSTILNKADYPIEYIYYVFSLPIIHKPEKEIQTTDTHTHTHRQTTKMGGAKINR